MNAPTRPRGAPLSAEDGQLRLAVLIDADNAQAAVIAELLAEVARFGDATVRRIYGDFTNPHSASWKKVLQRHSIKPVQQFAYSRGKNATDSALIIDAMDLLYTDNFDGFCLVTSDSDFTGLATRLREAGLMVFGFGERKTPEAFRNACHRFVFVEVLRAGSGEADAVPDSDTDSDIDNADQAGVGEGQRSQPDATQRGGGSRSPQDSAGSRSTPTSGSGEQAANQTTRARRTKFPKRFVLTALEHSVDDSGWAELSTFGRYLMKLQPDFDSRLYGHKKLSDLVRARTDLFITEERTGEGSAQPAIYVRAK